MEEGAEREEDGEAARRWPVRREGGVETRDPSTRRPLPGAWPAEVPPCAAAPRCRLSPEWPLGRDWAAHVCQFDVTSLSPSGRFLAPDPPQNQSVLGGGSDSIRFWGWRREGRPSRGRSWGQPPRAAWSTHSAERIWVCCCSRE